jgi:hypothetical protein
MTVARSMPCSRANREAISAAAGKNASAENSRPREMRQIG